MKRPQGKKINSLFLFILAFFCFDTALAAQDVIYKDPRPMEKIFKTEEKGPSKEKPAEEAEKKVATIYDPTGMTDPFKSFIAEQEAGEEKKKRKPMTYLETLDLSQLEVTAIILGSKENWAMVTESKGLGHVIKKGTAIGTNGGVVHEIKEKEIIIQEEYKDFRGQNRYRYVSKKMTSPPD